MRSLLLALLCLGCSNGRQADRSYYSREPSPREVGRFAANETTRESAQALAQVMRAIQSVDRSVHEVEVDAAGMSFLWDFQLSVPNNREWSGYDTTKYDNARVAFRWNEVRDIYVFVHPITKEPSVSIVLTRNFDPPVIGDKINLAFAREDAAHDFKETVQRRQP